MRINKIILISLFGFMVGCDTLSLYRGSADYSPTQKEMSFSKHIEKSKINIDGRITLFNFDLTAEFKVNNQSNQNFILTPSAISLKDANGKSVPISEYWSDKKLTLKELEEPITVSPNSSKRFILKFDPSASMPFVRTMQNVEMSKLMLKIERIKHGNVEIPNIEMTLSREK